MTYKKVFQLAQDKGYQDSIGESIKRLLWFTFKWMIPTRYINTIDGKFEHLNLILIQKWLRDEKELSVYCEIPIEIYWKYVIHGTGKRAAFYTDSSYKEKKEFTTYEAALLEGIAEALKLLP